MDPYPENRARHSIKPRFLILGIRPHKKSAPEVMSSSTPQSHSGFPRPLQESPFWATRAKAWYVFDLVARSKRKAWARLLWTFGPWAVSLLANLLVPFRRVQNDTETTYAETPTRRHTDTLLWNAVPIFLALILATAGHALCADPKPEWIGSLTSDKGPGSFIAPPSMRLSYRFGWSGIQAATADIHFFSPNRNTFEVDASGGTSGFPRTLFRLDLYHQATENKTTLMPIHFFQEERYRQETVKTNVNFEPDCVTGLREKIPSDHPAKPNVFRFSPVFDLTTALLWVRSQPLTDGDTESLVVWASNAPYLATVTVIGRDKVKIDGQQQNAIKLDLKLKGIDKKMRLKDHKLFKGGRGWLSDDEKRIPLRIEADIFIGYVFVELEAMQVE